MDRKKWFILRLLKTFKPPSFLFPVYRKLRTAEKRNDEMKKKNVEFTQNPCIYEMFQKWRKYDSPFIRRNFIFPQRKKDVFIFLNFWYVFTASFIAYIKAMKMYSIY